MKKETVQQIFSRKVNDNLIDVIFVKPTENTITPEEEMLKVMDSHRIKVQSVVLPTKHQLYSLKTEEQVLNWLQNKIHNINSAFHQINTKYTEDVERVNWNNNKMQNQRFLEIKNLYKERVE
jgi:hypothetical protein